MTDPARDPTLEVEDDGQHGQDGGQRVGVGIAVTAAVAVSDGFLGVVDELGGGKDG